jgi:hypothetical protein
MYLSIQFASDIKILTHFASDVFKFSVFTWTNDALYA